MRLKTREGSIKSLASLLFKTQTSVSSLVQKTEELRRLEVLLQASMPEERGKFYRVANYRDGVLVVFTESAIHLASFRFEEPALRKKLQEHLPDLRKLDIKIRPLLKRP